MHIDVPAYNSEEGFKFYWKEGFSMKVTSEGNKIAIRANKEGLTSLAVQLLTLAQDNVPEHYHIHWDEYNSLEEGSKELIVEKI